MDTEYVQGLDNLLAQIPKFDQLKQEFGKEALARVKERTPVDTGQLQAMWQLTIDDTNNIVIENKALNKDGDYYAPFVEFGTVHMRGFFMATQTIAESEDILQVAKARAGL